MDEIRILTDRVFDADDVDIIDSSKFFGAPAFPKDFAKNYIEDADYFVAQLNLADIAEAPTNLPKEGMLYFFLNVENYPYKAKILYTDEELFECLEDFNDYFDYITPQHVFYMDLDDGHGETHFFGDFEEGDLKDYDLNGFKCLLRIDAKLIPGFPDLGSKAGKYFYIISEADLENLDFSNVSFLSEE